MTGDKTRPLVTGNDDTLVRGDPAPRVGMRLGRYALVERLGIGGMAEVYLADQDGPAGFKKRVVVKRILPQLAAEAEFVEMFQREARVAARLSHPNVAQVFELGEEGGEFFIAMEFVDGLTLHKLCATAWQRGEGVPVDVIARTLADAAAGLHAAHTLVDEHGASLQLVHRDISPDNLIVSREGVTRVLDFGIAKGNFGGPRTQTGHLRGKIPFLAPEQVDGGNAGPAVDVWAIGVSAWWMLTGARPFDRESDFRTMGAILKDEPPALPVRHDVTPTFAQLLRSCLAKDPQQRPSSARVVADALEACASAGSMGGRRTTEAFVQRMLAPAPARAVAAPAAPTAATHADERAAPAPISFDDGSPAHAQAGPPGTRVMQPAGLAASSTPAAAPASSSTDTAAVHAVSRPAATNPFGRLLAPADPAAGVRPAVLAAIALGVAGGMALIAGGLFWWTRPPTSSIADAGPAHVDAGPALVVDAGSALVVDAGSARVVDAGSALVVDAGSALVVDAGSPLVVDAGTGATSTPVGPIAVTLVAPSRVRWFVDGRAAGHGNGVRTLDPGAHLVAEDPSWGCKTDVVVEAGVADFSRLPRGTVHVKDVAGTRVYFGDIDVSGRTSLSLVAGTCTARVIVGGRTRSVSIIVRAGDSLVFDPSTAR